jgi:hypothetical protein
MTSMRSLLSVHDLDSLIVLILFDNMTLIVYETSIMHDYIILIYFSFLSLTYIAYIATYM